MSKLIKKEIILDGLECASCSLKIEEKVGQIPKVNTASLNFFSKTLTIKTEYSEKMDDILKETHAIVKKLEPGVVIKEKKVTNENYDYCKKVNTGNILRFSISILVFCIAMI